jgi:predicted SAM-dependent methyltransferase
MNKLMHSMLKAAMPGSVRRELRLAQKAVVYLSRRQSIRFPVAANRPLQIIVGAAMTHQEGWYSTNEQWLDITREDHWREVFHGKALLTRVLAEHVFEHLTPDETRRALGLVARHMRSGGRIRIAVPDGYHPDPTYLRHVGIGGIGADAEDHKQLLNCDSLMQYLREAGFSADLKEGYRRHGELVQTPLDLDDGLVVRSRSNASTMAGRAGWDFADANTSLVVDGMRQA